VNIYPLITRDPASGEELIVTRLECPASGVSIDGRFSLGWVGKLTPEQLDFVGLLLRNRNNLQKLANDLGVAYNTARSRLDDVVAALGGAPDVADAPDTRSREALDKLAAGELSFEETLATLKKKR
jgi:hypothetical protein